MPNYVVQVSKDSGAPFQIMDKEARELISEETAAREADCNGLRNDLALNNNLTPKVSLTPNPKTISGVTVTVVAPGSVKLVGTCTGDFRIDYFSSETDYPDTMSRGTDYYIGMIGTDKSDTYIQTNASGSFQAIEQFPINRFVKITTPVSGGLRIMTMCKAGKTYNETMTAIILNKNIYTDGLIVDDTLIKSGASADAAVVGDRFSQLYTDVNANLAIVSTAEKSHNGLVFTADGGVVNVNGTSTGVAYFDLFKKLTMPGEFPFKEGHTYSLRFSDESLSTLIYKQVAYKETSSSGETSLYSKPLYSDAIVFTMPSCVDFWVRLVCDSANQTYSNKKITFIIEEITDKKDTIIVDVNGHGDFTSLKAAIEFAMLKYGTKVIVHPGTYDLVLEFGKTYLDNLSGNDFGIMLGNGIELTFAPNAYVSFDYDGTNDWVIANFSLFNTANNLGFTIDGLHCSARNCRYILHDDPSPEVKNKYSYNKIRNCYFELYPSPSYSSWINHQIIGGGFSDSTMVVIENCIFNDHFDGVETYSAVSYHNSTSGSSSFESRIVVKDNYFADGNQLVLLGYGESTLKSKAIVANNCFQNAMRDIIYDNTEADNINTYLWGNQSR